MKIRVLNTVSFQYWLTILSVLSIAVAGGFFSFNVSAQTKIVEESARQNLVLSRLAYVTTRRSFGGATDLLISTAKADGTDRSLIVLFPWGVEPVWSPDGTKIAYSLGMFDIYVKNANTGTDDSGTNITNNATSILERNPSWSVNGKIAYERGGQIWVMKADGTNQTQFSGITQPSPTSPVWSANGGKLAFSSGGEIWTINADGTNEQRVTTNTTTDTDPSWSPDGSKIVFTKGLGGIAVIDLNGTNETNLTNVSGDAEPAWSPDGTTIAFRRTGTNGGIYLMSDSGANQIRIIEDQPGPVGTGIGDTKGSPAWQPLPAPRRTPFDFDGDGRADVSVFRPTEGSWYQLRSTAGFASVPWGISSDVLAPADYDGDSKTDAAVWRPTDGNFYILNSFDNTVRVENFGVVGDIPTGGDWDGDGKADPAVYRGGVQSAFYYRGSMSNPPVSFTTIAWGTSGDKPIVGDYDGDGKTDAAVFRNGNWYILQSSNGQFSANNFGLAGDQLVPADYDADGKTDIAVYRSGNWYMMRSTQGFAALQFGISTDIPAPADYDGDGRADVAIYRNGVWWMMKSQSSAAEAVSFGVSGDNPISSAFVR